MSDIVQLLDTKALPYIIFLVVPVLGRMSDPDDDLRFLATNTFASLVKMVPLEVSANDGHWNEMTVNLCDNPLGWLARPSWIFF